jgi:hypothetical protein
MNIIGIRILRNLANERAKNIQDENLVSLLLNLYSDFSSQISDIIRSADNSAGLIASGVVLFLQQEQLNVNQIFQISLILSQRIFLYKYYFNFKDYFLILLFLFG